MVAVQTDSVGHINYGSGSDGVANGAPTLGAFTSTWGASGTSITGDDTSGNIAFTGGATPAAGAVVTVTFNKPYSKTPRAVLVQGISTDQSAGPLFSADTITQTSFRLVAAAGATKSYVVQYVVIAA